MDSGAIIAVVGTLGGAVISAIVTYVVQQRVAERQRKWALEDEERHQHRAVEEERRKLQRDLLLRRLDPIEEAVRLKDYAIYTAFCIEVGLPTPTDESATRNKTQKLHDIGLDAFNAVLVIGSEELKQNWEILSTVHCALEETGVLGPDGAEKAHDAYIAITRLLDEMRLRA